MCRNNNIAFPASMPWSAPPRHPSAATAPGNPVVGAVVQPQLGALSQQDFNLRRLLVWCVINIGTERKVSLENTPAQFRYSEPQTRYAGKKNTEPGAVATGFKWQLSQAVRFDSQLNEADSSANSLSTAEYLTTYHPVATAPGSVFFDPLNQDLVVVRRKYCPPSQSWITLIEK